MKFYGQGIPPVDKVLYESYFKDIKNGTLIECGACDGLLESSCKFFEEFMGWDSINIEPVPFFYEKLIINRPNSTNLNVALSNKTGTAEFINAVHPNRGENFGNGSLSHTQKHLTNLKKMKCTFKKYIVKTLTFTDMIEKLQLKHIDLFVLDVEGHEEFVINGMKDCSVLPKIMCIEHTTTKIDLNQLMCNLGYKLDQKVFVNSYFIKK